ncbi:unnamed protein product, partial [Rotaria sp. Silwood2]
MAALQISHGSVVNLKNELKQLEEEEQKVLAQQLLEQQQHNDDRNACSITIIIDNASWHREVTDDTKPPQCLWGKQMIVNWLDDHNILYVDDISKAELLQLAYENLPKKKYKVDEEAKIIELISY